MVLLYFKICDLSFFNLQLPFCHFVFVDLPAIFIVAAVKFTRPVNNNISIAQMASRQNAW
jgi:hypothetical protein